MSQATEPPLSRLSFRHRERLRVRWAEVDLQQIVFNGHYLMYFDTALAGYWRALALPYHDAMAVLAGDLYMRKATLEYEGSARYDELLEVGIRCSRIGNSSMRLQAAVFRGERRLVLGELVYVFADPTSQTARPVPGPLRDLLTAFEAGESVFELRSGGWNTLGMDASAVRQTVFVGEQGIPAALELDAADAQALHAVAYNRLGQALGTGRLLDHAPGIGRIGRMAVLASVRGAGIGRLLLDRLVQMARERGDHEVILHAQSSAIGFYGRAGFTPQGPPFEEAGIPHQEMALGLR